MTWQDFFSVYFSPLEEPSGGYVISCKTCDWNGRLGPLPGYYTSLSRALVDAKLMFQELEKRIETAIELVDD